MSWGRQARAGRPRAGHSPPANPRALPRWPGAGLLSGSPLAGSSGPRPVSPRRHLGGHVGTQWFSVAAPGGSVGCQARDWAAEAWCPARPVSCTSLAVPSRGALLSYAAAVPGLPASAQGGRFSCISPQPPPPGAHSPQRLPAPRGPHFWGGGYSGSLGRQPTARPCTAEAGSTSFCASSPELGRMVRLSLFLLPGCWTGTPFPGFWGPLCWSLCPHPCVPAGTCCFW